MKSTKDSIIGVGIDLVDVGRFNNIDPGFARSIFTEPELKECSQKPNPAESLAARFAAKEAVAKCLGGKIDMRDIEITNLKGGQPKVTLLPISKYRGYHLSVSLSHTATMAGAVCICTKDE